jgi:hypothetical protein
MPHLPHSLLVLQESPPSTASHRTSVAAVEHRRAEPFTASLPSRCSMSSPFPIPCPVHPLPFAHASPTGTAAPRPPCHRQALCHNRCTARGDRVGRVCAMHVHTWAGSLIFFGWAGPAQKALGQESACQCSPVFNSFIPLFISRNSFSIQKLIINRIKIIKKYKTNFIGILLSTSMQ